MSTTKIIHILFNASNKIAHTVHINFLFKITKFEYRYIIVFSNIIKFHIQTLTSIGAI